jgi:SAM-dependent methyltransferase
VLWRALIDEWRLAPHEVEYVNRQQGKHCRDCRANLRTMALALAIMRSYDYVGLFSDFVSSPQAAHLRILEINEAGFLTQYLARLSGHQLGTYPDLDMLALPYDDGAFDLVVHSDTLEHVAHPVRGLAECRRVLAPTGRCAFTVPVIVGRLSSSRAGLPPSFHGSAATPQLDYLVHTEYGADMWTQLFLAGFQECRIVSMEYPAAQALVGIAPG